MYVTGCCRGDLALLRDEIINSDDSWYIERKTGQGLNIYELGVVSHLTSDIISFYNKKTNLLIADFQGSFVIGLLAINVLKKAIMLLQKRPARYIQSSLKI